MKINLLWCSAAKESTLKKILKPFSPIYHPTQIFRLILFYYIFILKSKDSLYK